LEIVYPAYSSIGGAPAISHLYAPRTRRAYVLRKGTIRSHSWDLQMRVPCADPWFH
jgi:hypothetical protein